MGEFSELFKHKKNLITLLLLGILILAVPIGINLIKNQQIFKSRAGGVPIEIKETLGVFQRNKPGGGTEWVAKKDAKISLELTSPLGPPGTNNILSCSDDSECIAVKVDTCGCSGGGNATSINKNYVDQWNKNKDDPSAVCPAVMSGDWTCINASPKCISNECKLVKGAGQ